MICSGGTPKSSNPEFYNGTIPWLNTKEVNFSRIYKTTNYITQKGLEASSAKWIAENSIIIAMYGATAAKVGISKIPLTTNQACCNLCVDPLIADYQYVYYYLCHQYEKLFALANGGAQQNLSVKVIKEFKVCLPPLILQKAIAAVLSALDDKIELNNRINKNLEAQAQAIFKSWFVDFEPFRDGEFVDSELGPIPKGWRVGRLGEIIKTNAHSYKASSNWEYVNYLDTGNITNNVIQNIQQIDLSVEKLPSRARRIVESGDVIFSSVRPNQNHFGVIMNPEKNMLVSTGFIVIGGESKLFAYYYLTQSQIIETLQAIAEQTVSTYPSIKATDIESLEVLLPPPAQVKAFSDIVYSLHKLIAKKQSESNSLATIRDTLLPKLMSGEIRVPLEV